MSSSDCLFVDEVLWLCRRSFGILRLCCNAIESGFSILQPIERSKDTLYQNNLVLELTAVAVLIVSISKEVVLDVGHKGR